MSESTTAGSSYAIFVVGVLLGAACGRGVVGLGLAIVRSIVAAHQADLVARPRPGGGLEIKITLPGR